MALSPAQVHAQEHLGPVRRFGPARTGADGKEGVTLVVLSTEKESASGLGVVALELRRLPGDFRQEFLVLFLLGQIEQLRRGIGA